MPYFWSDWYSSRIQFVGTPVADEVRVIQPDPEKFLALYRRGQRLVGTLTVNGQRQIMKYRRQIAERGSWEDALTYAEQTLTAGAR